MKRFQPLSFQQKYSDRIRTLSKYSHTNSRIGMREDMLSVPSYVNLVFVPTYIIAPNQSQGSQKMRIFSHFQASLHNFRSVCTVYTLVQKFLNAHRCKHFLPHFVTQLEVGPVGQVRTGGISFVCFVYFDILQHLQKLQIGLGQVG